MLLPAASAPDAGLRAAAQDAAILQDGCVAVLVDMLSAMQQRGSGSALYKPSLLCTMHQMPIGRLCHRQRC